MLQTRTSYAARPSASRTRANTSHGVARSPSTTPSTASTAIRCRRSTPGSRFGLNPANDVFRATGRVCTISQNRTTRRARMHNPPLLHVSDYLGPAAGAIVFVLIMSLVKEPTRRNFNAIFVAGASGVYLSGGFGSWELLYTAVAGGVVAYLG